MISGDLEMRTQEIADSLHQCSSLPDIQSQDYLIKGWFDQEAISVVYGDSNTGKSFFVLDLAFHIASGREWFGHRTKAASVLYLAMEGGRGFPARLRAIESYKPELFSTAEGRITYLPIQLDLHAGVDVEALTEAITANSYGLIVVDTLAMAMGEGSENEGRDMAAFLKGVTNLRNRCQSHMMLVHHSGKDKSRGARGHTSLRAAIDTEIEITESGSLRTAKSTKQRDLIRGEEIGFTLRSVSIGRDSDGDEMTSCVVIPADPKDVKRKKRLSGLAEVAFQALQDALAECGEKRSNNPDFPSLRVIVSLDEWRKQYKRKRADKDIKHASLIKDFSRQADKLQELDYVRIQDGYAWVVDVDRQDK